MPRPPNAFPASFRLGPPMGGCFLPEIANNLFFFEPPWVAHLKEVSLGEGTKRFHLLGLLC